MTAAKTTAQQQVVVSICMVMVPHCCCLLHNSSHTWHQQQGHLTALRPQSMSAKLAVCSPADRSHAYSARSRSDTEPRAIKGVHGIVILTCLCSCCFVVSPLVGRTRTSALHYSQSADSTSPWRTAATADSACRQEASSWQENDLLLLFYKKIVKSFWN